MKKMILLSILKELKSTPELRKKLKTFFIIGFIGVMLLGGLTLWAGYSAFMYATKTTSQFLNTSLAQDQMQTTLAQIQRAKLQPLDCWNQAQRLLEISPWLEQPLSDHLQSLKNACLDSKPDSCEGPHCSQIQQLINTSKGGST